MPELLLEVGCEELPATSVRRAYSDLLAAVGEQLRAAGVLRSEGEAMGTPRRLIVSFRDLLERQADSEKEQRGPSLKAAFDADGNPTQALLGFCKSQGVEPATVRKDDAYVWVTKKIEGRETLALLQEELPKAIRSLSFDKTMRWGSSRMRFARPIRWLLASFGGQVVDFEIEGVRSGLESRGHRFYAPEPFAATSLDGLLKSLRARHVEPDPEARRIRIVEDSEAIANGVPMMPSELIEENVFLTEWPNAIQGSFKGEYQMLPEPVLITAMAKHEKMFPVRTEGGALTNRFIFIRNSGEDDSVRSGCEWVLNARFNDARFFYLEDQARTMDEYLRRTEGILFQEALGTVRARADRLANLAAAVAEATGAPPEESRAARSAGLYAKADLSTGLVSELASLQGVIGGEYARRDGLGEDVAAAISCQYDPGKAAQLGDSPAGRVAKSLIVADQLDKLAGYLGLGLAPSGSSDPFGLRRAATILIETAWSWAAMKPSYDSLLGAALHGYAEQAVALDADRARSLMGEIFANRYPTLMPEARYDVLDAALVPDDIAGATSPRTISFRVRCLGDLVADEAFVQTATRPINIVVAARKKGIEIPQSPDRQSLDSPEGVELLVQIEKAAPDVRKAVETEDERLLAQTLRSLGTPIVRFFDTTLVMAEEPRVRNARLALMQSAAACFLQAGDFSKIVQEG